MDPLQPVPKGFNNVLPLRNNLVSLLFLNNLRCSIYALLYEQDDNSNDWDAIDQQAIDTKTKAACKPFSWCKKVKHATLVAIGQQNRRNQKSKRILRLKSIVPLPQTLIVQMANSLAKFWVGFQKRIFFQIKEISKSNFPTIWWPVVMLLSIRKTRSKIKKTFAKSNIKLIGKNAIL